jgi:hypothetical protein
MDSRPSLEVTPSAFGGLAGAARREITPPAGIYARMWGASTHDRAEGVHRPLTCTVVALRARDDPRPRLLVAVDLALIGDMASPDDFDRVVSPVRDALDLEQGRVLVNCSHTHAVPWTATSRSELPGGELIGPYLDDIGAAIREAGLEGVAGLVPATLTWAPGRCDLAANRDLPAPDPGSDRVLCGYNPGIAADDTLVVGRVTSDRDGTVLATIVNYACHPTTLAWENRLISPDYIGAMRDLVEGASGGAPCLFLQGASGDLGPAHDYVADPAVADGHGRRLGFAALSTLAGMLPPRHGLRYEGLMESGAPLALWRPAPFAPSGALAGGSSDVALPLKPLPTRAQLEEQLAATEDRALRERLVRKAHIVTRVGGSAEASFPAWVWRVGQSLLVAHPNEAYSRFQQDLRAAFPDCTVVVANVSGTTGAGYLYPFELDGHDVYQVWQSPFAADAMQALQDACTAEGRRLLARP